MTSNGCGCIFIYALTCFLDMGDLCSRSNLAVIQSFVLLASERREALRCCKLISGKNSVDHSFKEKCS
ncbi:hypothetical protein H5410_031376 [Solanum commersonii]|uniref:Uncharacterized protein n=1 Tax=Solanum commersonii TaxID=4109 RepID=A0A9J5YM50_SOLCO|nr:hypothetical protein H5410_031376 [Solanum commersonii]